MNINATIFIQAFNFFLSYLILRFLLLRPALTEIEQEKQEEDLLISTIERTRQKMSTQEQERQQKWELCQDFFKKHTPDVTNLDRYIFKRISPPAEYPHLSDDELEKIRKQAQQLLIKKIGAFHDRA